jgi:FkbM family methyltransferase
MVSIRNAKQGFQLRKRGGGANNGGGFSQSEKEKMGLVAAGLCIGVLLVVFYQSMGIVGQAIPDHLRKSKPHPQLLDQQQGGSKPMGDRFDAVALDILETLDCAQLFADAAALNKSGGDGGARMTDDFNGERRRRLDEAQHGDDGGFDGGVNNQNNQNGGGDASGEGGDDTPEEEEKWGREANNNNNNNWSGEEEEGEEDGQPKWGDDGYNGGAGDFDGASYMGTITAKHLFCLAASAESPPSDMQQQIRCDASDTKRKTLLELWSAARAQMQPDALLKVLQLAREQQGQTLLGKSYHLWAPDNDDGLSYMLSSLNSENNADNGGIHGLQESLGYGKLFVDVGSCLGLTSLAIAQEYPGTKIVSIEPAAPNWLLQEMNLRCNLEHDDFSKIKIVLAGVGPNTVEEDNLMAKLMWRPTATTSTRAWTPSEEQNENDMELLVRLRRLKSVLAEADVYGVNIDVLNVDCEGCEYNLIPALSDAEFDAIPTVMGGVHWGYIPTPKLPSSERAKVTHERLCQHENIAKTAKECCDVPNVKVKSSVPGEILVQDKKGFPPPETTVKDVIQEGLCDDFEEWATAHYLHDVKDDWGWMELTSQTYKTN